MSRTPAHPRRRPRRQSFAPFLSLLLGWASSASGQALGPAELGGPSGAVHGGPSGGTSGSTDERSAQARQLVTEADRFFRTGDAAGSVPLLERAYELGGWPGCLLNLAMAHHALSNCEVALDYYQRYLSADPYTDRRAEVQDALNELQHICAASWQPSASQLPPESPPRDVVLQSVEPRPAALDPTPAMRSGSMSARASASARASRVLEWSLLGAGTASGVAAIVFTLASQRKNEDADHFATFSDGDPRAHDTHDTGVRYNRLSWGFGIGAAVLLGSGATLLLLDAPGDSSVVLATGAFPSVRYQGRF